VAIFEVSVWPMAIPEISAKIMAIFEVCPFKIEQVLWHMGISTALAGWTRLLHRSGLGWVGWSYLKIRLVWSGPVSPSGSAQ
jgi:hypothetical protein